MLRYFVLPPLEISSGCGPSYDPGRAEKHQNISHLRHAPAHPSWSRSCAVAFGPRGVLLALHEAGVCARVKSVCHLAILPPFLLPQLPRPVRNERETRRCFKRDSGELGCAGGGERLVLFDALFCAHSCRRPFVITLQQQQQQILTANLSCGKIETQLDTSLSISQSVC